MKRPCMTDGKRCRTTVEKLEELMYVGFKATDIRFQETAEYSKVLRARKQDTDEPFQDVSEGLRRPLRQPARS